MKLINVRIPVSHGSIDFVDGFVDVNDFDVNDDVNSGIFTPILLIYINNLSIYINFSSFHLHMI